MHIDVYYLKVLASIYMITHYLESSLPVTHSNFSPSFSPLFNYYTQNAISQLLNHFYPPNPTMERLLKIYQPASNQKKRMKDFGTSLHVYCLSYGLITILNYNNSSFYASSSCYSAWSSTYLLRFR